MARSQQLKVAACPVALRCIILAFCYQNFGFKIRHPIFTYKFFISFVPLHFLCIKVKSLKNTVYSIPNVWLKTSWWNDQLTCPVHSMAQIYPGWKWFELRQFLVLVMSMYKYMSSLCMLFEWMFSWWVKIVEKIQKHKLWKQIWN